MSSPIRGGISDRFLDPGLHPVQVLMALKGFIDAKKRQCGFPVTPALPGELSYIWERAQVSNEGYRAFGNVMDSYIPCRIQVLPEGNSIWVKVDTASFDRHYGAGACYRALNAFHHRLATPRPGDQLGTEGLPDIDGELPEPARARFGEQKARKAAAASGATPFIMDAVARLEALVGAQATADTVASLPGEDGMVYPVPRNEWDFDALSRGPYLSEAAAIAAAKVPPKETRAETAARIRAEAEKQREAWEARKAELDRINAEPGPVPDPPEPDSRQMPEELFFSTATHDYSW